VDLQIPREFGDRSSCTNRRGQTRPHTHLTYPVLPVSQSPPDQLPSPARFNTVRATQSRGANPIQTLAAHDIVNDIAQPPRAGFEREKDARRVNDDRLLSPALAPIIPAGKVFVDVAAAAQVGRLSVQYAVLAIPWSLRTTGATP
jgi:hypothetical protein